MQCWLNEQALPLVSELNLPDSPLGRMVSQAYTEQAAIGWNMFFRGFISQSWKDAQGIHFAHAKSRIGQDSTNWTASVVSWIFELFETVWSQQNLAEFGADPNTARLKKLVLCETAIRRLFIAGQELPHDEQHPFRIDIATLLSRRLPVQEMWIANTERFLPRAYKRVAGNKKSGQTAITEFFKRKNSSGNEVQVDLEAAATGVT